MEGYFIIVGLTCLGWFSAKLINYLADILPISERRFRASCAYCGQNKPIWQYLSLSYDCPHCNAPYGKRYWLVDLLSVAIVLGLGLSVKDPGSFLLLWMLWLYFAVTIIVDLERHKIYREEWISGVIVCAVFGSAVHGLNHAIIGGLSGFISMLVIYVFGVVYIRYLARKRMDHRIPSAIGFGDVILSGNVGLCIGFPKIIPAIFLSIFLAGMMGILIKVYQRFFLYPQKSIEWIPLSPFIICSVVVIEGLAHFEGWL